MLSSSGHDCIILLSPCSSKILSYLIISYPSQRSKLSSKPTVFLVFQTTPSPQQAHTTTAAPRHEPGRGEAGRGGDVGSPRDVRDGPQSGGETDSVSSAWDRGRGKVGWSTWVDAWQIDLRFAAEEVGREAETHEKSHR